MSIFVAFSLLVECIFVAFSLLVECIFSFGKIIFLFTHHTTSHVTLSTDMSTNETFCPSTSSDCLTTNIPLWCHISGMNPKRINKTSEKKDIQTGF